MTPPRYHSCMPAYSYEALTSDGDTRKGVVEADNPRTARGLLRAQALVPLQVELMGTAASDSANSNTPGRSTTLWRARAFNATALAIWTRQLAGLVASGLPLERALTALADEAEEESQRAVVAALRAEVNGGTTFATALAQHPREFSTTYCAVVGAGEHSGDLGLVLERLADRYSPSSAPVMIESPASQSAPKSRWSALPTTWSKPRNSHPSWSARPCIRPS